MRKTLAIGLAVVALLAACSKAEKGKKEGGEAKGTCEAPPAALTGAPELPAGFPSPDEVTYTDSRVAGPSTIVEGYWEADISEAFTGYRDAFEGASGYEITRDEQERDDAEVFFASDANTGQVKLREECAGRTTVSITIRPA